MAKKRGNKSSKATSKPTKKIVKSDFQEKKITYPNVRNSTQSKDPELNKELSELEAHRYYGQKTDYGKKTEEKEVYEKKADRPKISFQKGDSKVPSWFYSASIFAAFLFTIYISIFATIHFENIEFMNITIVFLFISMVSFFLVSMVFMVSEKMKYHAIAPALFFFGIASIMIYAFKAVDTSNLVRFSIIYTIIVAAISAYVLAIRRW